VIPEHVVRETIRNIFDSVPSNWLRVAAGYRNPEREDDWHFAGGSDRELAFRAIGEGDFDYTLHDIQATLRGNFDGVINGLTHAVMGILDRQAKGEEPKKKAPRPKKAPPEKPPARKKAPPENKRSTAASAYQGWLREAKARRGIDHKQAQKLYQQFKSKLGKTPSTGDLIKHPRIGRKGKRGKRAK
jgi:hypothetical protein